jgi:hypothetical protein
MYCSPGWLARIETISAREVELAVGRRTPGSMPSTTNGPIGGGTGQSLDDQRNLLCSSGLNDACWALASSQGVVVYLTRYIVCRIGSVDIETGSLKGATLRHQLGRCDRQDGGHTMQLLQHTVISFTSPVMLQAWYDAATMPCSNKITCKRKDLMMQCKMKYLGILRGHCRSEKRYKSAAKQRARYTYTVLYGYKLAKQCRGRRIIGRRAGNYDGRFRRWARRRMQSASK